MGVAFSADATMFLKNHVPWKLENLSSKVAHNRPHFFFIIANRLKISPKLICSIKMAPCSTLATTNDSWHRKLALNDKKSDFNLLIYVDCNKVKCNFMISRVLVLCIMKNVFKFRSPRENLFILRVLNLQKLAWKILKLFAEV